MQNDDYYEEMLKKIMPKIQAELCVPVVYVVPHTGCKILVGMYRKCYTHTGDHLKNLGSCDANWDKLGGFVAGCPDSVVTVHDSVNHVVDRAEPST